MTQNPAGDAGRKESIKHGGRRPNLQIASGQQAVEKYEIRVAHRARPHPGLRHARGMQDDRSVSLELARKRTHVERLNVAQGETVHLAIDSFEKDSLARVLAH